MGRRRRLLLVPRQWRRRPPSLHLGSPRNIASVSNDRTRLSHSPSWCYRRGRDHGYNRRDLEELRFPRCTKLSQTCLHDLLNTTSRCGPASPGAGLIASSAWLLAKVKLASSAWEDRQRLRCNRVSTRATTANGVNVNGNEIQNARFDRSGFACRSRSSRGRARNVPS